MTNSAIDQLANTYFALPNEENFNALYRALLKNWEKNFDTIAKNLKCSPHEVRALYEDKLLSCLEKYKHTGSFEKFLSKSLKNVRADFSNKIKRHEQHIQPHFDEQKESGDKIDGLEYLIATHTKPINQVEREIFEPDIATEKKREIIEYLLTTCGDSATRHIVESYLVGLNYTAISQKTGIKRNTVTRKIQRLSRYYDETKFGAIEFYL